MTTEQSVLATLAYHDIFDYPLTKEEIWKYQINKKSSPSSLEKTLLDLLKLKKIETHNNLYSLKGRGMTIKLRTKRAKYSRLKLKKANFYAKILKAIPLVKLVALTGALAMQNSDKNDDIDILIVTASNRLWSTRLAVTLLLYPYKRKPGKIHTNNKACLNIFLTENSLKIRTQNLYTAHEVVQTRPIWQRGKTYLSFANANSWVKNYLPNWQPYSLDSAGQDKRQKTKYERLRTLVVSRLALVFEIFAKKFQLYHMRHRLTTEKIGNTQLFFHPSNTQKFVLEEYRKRCKMR